MVCLALLLPLAAREKSAPLHFDGFHAYAFAMPTPRPLSRGESRARALSLLRALVGGLTASARAVERRTGVTNAQLFLLRELAANGSLPIGDLALRAKTQASTASIVVARLARAGFVTKHHAPDDKRRTLVTITTAGQRLVRAAPVPPTARLLAALKHLSALQARALVRGLEPLVRDLRFEAEDPPMLFEGRVARRRGR